MKCQAQKDIDDMIHLYNVPRIVKFIETESSMVIARAREGGNEIIV